MKTKSALSWFGSDSENREALASYFTHCDSVTVAMVGGGSIIPVLTAPRLVCNDKNYLAYNFYKCCQDDRLFKWLANRCRHTLSHPAEVQEATILLRKPYVRRLDVSLAWAFWAACWVGRKGQGGTEGISKGVSVRWTSGGSNATRLVTVAEDLYAWAQHFKRCEFTNLCFRVLLPKVPDRAGCGIYADPPWVEEGLSYTHAFVEQDHRDLARLLEGYTETAVVVRYRDHALLRELYPSSMWKWIDARSKTQAGEDKGEVWIVNNLAVPLLEQETYPELVL